MDHVASQHLERQEAPPTPQAPDAFHRELHLLSSQIIEPGKNGGSGGGAAGGHGEVGHVADSGEKTDHNAPLTPEAQKMLDTIDESARAALSHGGLPNLTIHIDGQSVTWETRGQNGGSGGGMSLGGAEHRVVGPGGAHNHGPGSSPPPSNQIEH